MKRIISYSYLLISLVFIFTAARSEVCAGTIYVSLSGNDSNSGSLSEPVATPARALLLAAPGDTVYLRSGTYTVAQSLVINKANLTVASYPGERATIANSASSNPTSIIIVGSSYVSVVDLEIVGGSYYGIKVTHDLGVMPANVRIKGCRVRDSGSVNIKTQNADNLIIEDCEVGPSGDTGITVMGSIGATIRRCYAHDTGKNGMFLKAGTRKGIIENCRVENTATSGILLGSESDKVFMRDGVAHEAIDCVARNNVVINTGASGLGSISGSNIRFENNTLINVAKTIQAAFRVVPNAYAIKPEKILFKNNVVVLDANSARPLAHIVNLADQIICDSNIWFSPNGSYKFWRESSAGNNYWKSFSEWQQGMYCDSSSKTVDPKLDASKLYTPLADSPAIDSGEALTETSSDYSGTARPQGPAYDIGAHERRGMSLTLNPPSITGGKSSVATITLSDLAPTGGANITLSSNSTSVATVPVSVVVAEGATSRTFTVKTNAVSSTSTAAISASYGGDSKTADLTVLPPVLSGLTLTPSTITGPCQISTGKVMLSGKAATGGVLVTLSSTNPVVVVPASVTVPSGDASATFPISASSVSTNQVATLTVSYQDKSFSRTLRVLPIAVKSLELALNPVVGPRTVMGTVTLVCAAPAGGLVVTLTSSAPAVASVPQSITIPAGSVTGTFSVTASDVSVTSYATISAKLNDSTKSVILTIN